MRVLDFISSFNFRESQQKEINGSKIIKIHIGGELKNNWISFGVYDYYESNLEITSTFIKDDILNAEISLIEQDDDGIIVVHIEVGYLDV